MLVVVKKMIIVLNMDILIIIKNGMLNIKKVVKKYVKFAMRDFT